MYLSFSAQKPQNLRLKGESGLMTIASCRLLFIIIISNSIFTSVMALSGLPVGRLGRHGKRIVFQQKRNFPWKRNTHDLHLETRPSRQNVPLKPKKAYTMGGTSIMLLLNMFRESTTLCHTGEIDVNDNVMVSTKEQVREENQKIPDGWCSFDTYNGVIINFPEEYTNAEAEILNDEIKLKECLSRSLQEWEECGKRGIWINSIPNSHVHLYPMLVREFGFEFHQAASFQKTVVLTKWLPKDEESRLPHGATHQVGVGVIVFHPSQPNKMLVVQEKSGPAAASKLWKMPTGLVDPGEDISDAAVRELKEETGISCAHELDRIVGFRQAHPSSRYPNRPSDLFFLCHIRLTPGDEEIQLKAQETEIADIQWMDIDDYMNQHQWKDSPLFQSMHQVLYDLRSNDETTNRNNNNIGFVSKKLPLGFRPGFQTVYVHDNEKSKL